MKIFSKDYKHLNTYLKSVSELIEKEIIINIPDKHPKEFLYDLINDSRNFI